MDPIPYRIRLGVTGHRPDKLGDQEEISKQIYYELREGIVLLLGEKTKNAYYTLVSPLAEGADRLVANAVLNFDESSILEVALPLTLTDYLGTFDQSDDSRRSFYELYDKAAKKTVLRDVDLDNDPTVVIEEEENRKDSKKRLRKDAYERVGHYVVDKCDVLIAIWDRKEANGKGGTEEIVRYARSKNKPHIIIDANQPDKVERIKGSGLKGETFELIDWYNGQDVQDLEKKIAMKTASKQRKFIELNEQPGRGKGEEANNQGQNTSSGWEHPINALRNNIYPYFIKASEMADRSKKRYRPTSSLIYICSALAIVSVMFGILFPPAYLYVFILEFICLITILVIYFYSRQFHRRWLECRFLAERFRSSVHFVLAGFNINSIKVPRHMGVAHKYNDWMVQVFEAVWRKLPRTTRLNPGQFEFFRNYIRQDWMVEQEEYHSEKVRRMDSANKRFEVFGWIIFTIALLASGIHIVHEFTGVPHTNSILEAVMLFLAIALPAIGAAVVAIRKHGEFERVESRSRHLKDAIAELKEECDNVETVDELERLMNEFDELMLRENQDWLGLMKLVKLEVYP